MGGGGSDAPDSPDYSEIIKAASESADYSFANAKEMMDWAKKAYAENKGLSDDVIKNALGWMTKQGEWATQDRERYENVFQPAEDKLVQDAMSYNSQQRQEMEAGKAEADVAAQFAQARQAAQDRLESYGVDPSQTRRGAMDLGTRVAEAAAQASAGNQARARTEDTGRELLGKAVGQGNITANRSQAEVAGSGTFGNQAINTGLATTASGAQTMGTGMDWQGMGNQGLNVGTNAKNTQFSNEMDKYNADQAQSSGWGELAGTVAGALPWTKMLGFAEGGEIPHDGIPVPPEASPSGGAIPDDIPAEINGGGPAKINAGEFIVPKDVVGWLGEKGMQQVILKARKEMQGGNGERPAQPSMGPPPPAYDGAGAIPTPEGM